MLQLPRATVLLLFIHGFKGHDHHTFLDFPTRIMTIFTNAKLNLDVESVVYPQYDTRGNFNAAVKNFAEWTQSQVKARQGFNQRVYGDTQGKTDAKTGLEQRIPPVYVCFLGHSMGGLVAADTAIYLNSLPEKSPVVGILGFDTPYLGLNSTIFTQAAYDRVTGIAQKASGAYSLVSAYLPAAAAWNAITPSSTDAPTTNARSGGSQKDKQSEPSSAGGFSLWSTTTTKVEKEKTVTPTGSKSESKWGWGSIALGVGAAVVATGAAVMVNKHLNTGMEYVTSHIQFVGILWNSTELERRVSDVLRLPMGFHCFYTQVQIPASSSNNWRSTSRTFIELASIPADQKSYFSARSCSGQDEIEAHTEMFNPTKNFDYYPMGEEAVKRINNMVEDALNKEHAK